MDENVSLADLLGFDEHVAEPLRARVRKLAERWPLPAGKLRASAVEQVVERVRERLSPRLYRVLAAAWRHHPACQEFCDAQKYPPNEVNTVELASHNVEWGCEPAVEVIADGLKATGMSRLAQLEFKIQVVAAVRCGVVTIQDGRFMKMDAAELTLSAEMSVETHSVVDLQVPVKLPGTIRFGEHGEPICLPDMPESQAPTQIAVPAIVNPAGV